MRTFGALLILAVCHYAAAAAASESPGPLPLSSCTLPDMKQPARCGALEVLENPNRPNGRRLSIKVVVVPATSGTALPDPIVVLMGGPGEDAISAAAAFADRLAPLRKDRDLLLVDQRGTGQSGGLRCALYAGGDPAVGLRDMFPPDGVKKCERALRERADLTQYTYAHFANDLENIRRALGYGPLNLSAGSYGTRAAQVFLRAYPQSVRTAYIDSVVPIDITTPLTMAKSAEAALEGLFSTCVADAACHAAFPNLREEFRQVRARLDAGVARVSVPGRAEPVALHAGRVAEWFRSQLYRPSSAAAVPWTIHRAYEGDWTPIAEGILSVVAGLDSALSMGLFFSITCNEDVAFIGEKEIETETRGTFLGDYRVRQQQGACKLWPKVALPPEYRKPVRSSVPTLFIAGDADGASPLSFTQHIAPGFSNRAVLIARGQGHTEWSDCIAGVYQRFISSGSARELGAPSCETPRPAFKTR